MGAAGTPPSAALVPAQQTPLWIESGVLQPLDKWAKRDGITRELFFDGYWPQMVIQGTMWRLPFQMDVNHVWFWHKNALRAAGFNPEQPPTAISAVDEMALKLTRGATGAHEQFGLVPWLASQETAAMQTWGFAFGGEFYDATKDRVTADHPKIVEALEWMVGWARRLGGYDVVMQQMLDLGGPDRAFANGKMVLNGLNSTALNAARTINPGLDVGSALFPGATGLKPGEATWLSGRGVGMSAGAKDPESAWAFAKWVGATKEGTLSAVNRIAATPGLKASPGLAILEKDPQYKPFVDAVRVAKKNPISALISTQIWGSGRNVMLQEALQQKRTPREALAEIARTAQVEHEAVRAKQKR
jgi:multiple sugar transport system substrate-binding protein